MSSSGEAFTFFKEWMDSKRNLLVMATFGDVAVSGVGRIETFNEHLFVADKASRFSMLIPLEDSLFTATDPRSQFWLT